MYASALGQHFAQPDRRARIDLGPEIPGITRPEDYESRQMFEKGLNAMLSLSRRPRALQDPIGPASSPELRQYQEASQWLQLRDPARAAELAHTAGQMGVMAQRRQARTVLFKRPPGPIPGVSGFADYSKMSWVFAAGFAMGAALTYVLVVKPPELFGAAR